MKKTEHISTEEAFKITIHFMKQYQEENKILKQFAKRIFKNRKSATLGMPFQLCKEVENILSKDN